MNRDTNFCIDWESHEASGLLEARLQGPQSQFLVLQVEKPRVFTVQLDYSQTPASNNSLTTASPVTEVVFHYFEHPVDEAQRKQVKADAASFVSDLHAELPTMESFASGWQLKGESSMFHENMSNGGAIMFIKLLGWPSIEEHMKARYTKAFQSQLPNLKLGAKESEMRHVPFKHL